MKSLKPIGIGALLILTLLPKFAHGNGLPPEKKPINVLFLGSTALNDWNVPSEFSHLIESARFGHVQLKSITGSYLHSLWAQPQAIRVLESRQWDLIILQGAELSVSGAHPIGLDEAIKLAQLAHKYSRDALLLAFPGDFSGSSFRTYRKISKSSAIPIVPVALYKDLVSNENRSIRVEGKPGQAPAQGYLLACGLFYWYTRQNRMNPTWIPTGLNAKDAETCRRVVARTWSRFHRQSFH